MEDSIFTIQTLVWIMHQPVMIIAYLFITVAFILEKIEIINERKVKVMKTNRALTYIAKIKLNWLKANANQYNVLCGLDFMQRVFDKGIADGIRVAKTSPDSVEEYMSKIHDELLGMCATPSAKVLLDEVFEH